MESIEQPESDESLLNLADDHKREEEELRKKITQLEEKLKVKEKNLKVKDEKIDALKNLLAKEKEINDEVQKMQNGSWNFFKWHREPIHQKLTQLAEKSDEMEQFRDTLREIEDHFEVLGQLNQALIVRGWRFNDELQEARKKMVNILSNLPQNGNISVKRMGELDNEPFIRAIKRIYSAEEAEEKTIEICSLWVDHLRDPSWHPFNIITVDGDYQAVINPEDEKLNTLKEQLGDEVYESVITALTELEKYNPSGRYPIPELWNYPEGREATLKEAISYLFEM